MDIKKRNLSVFDAFISGYNNHNIAVILVWPQLEDTSQAALTFCRHIAWQKRFQSVDASCLDCPEHTVRCLFWKSCGTWKHNSNIYGLWFLHRHESYDQVHMVSEDHDTLTKFCAAISTSHWEEFNIACLQVRRIDCQTKSMPTEANLLQPMSKLVGVHLDEKSTHVSNSQFTSGERQWVQDRCPESGLQRWNHSIVQGECCSSLFVFKLHTDYDICTQCSLWFMTASITEYSSFPGK